MAADAFGEAGDDMGDYVPAVFARSPDEAERYCQLLEDHDIPAVADEEYELPRRGRNKAGGVAVLVPESLLEDARAFIRETEQADNFPADDELEEDDQDQQDDKDDQLEQDELDLDEDELKSEDQEDDAGEDGLDDDQELEEEEEEEEDDDDLQR